MLRQRERSVSLHERISEHVDRPSELEGHPDDFPLECTFETKGIPAVTREPLRVFMHVRFASGRRNDGEEIDGHPRLFVELASVLAEEYETFGNRQEDTAEGRPAQ